MNKVRIVAAVVDVQRLRLYQEDGSTIDIPQGDSRVARILAEVTPILKQGGIAWVEVGQAGETGTFAQFEQQAQKGGSMVRLFRMAKKTVTDFFANRVPDQQLGNIPNQEKDARPTDGSMPAWTPAVSDASAAPVAQQVDQLDAALEDIMKHAVPVSSAHFSEKSVNADDNDKDGDTVVAVVEREDGRKTLVPNIERIKPQLANAVKLGSTTAVEKFMQRMANVVDQRSHSVDDLLKFMRRADLPIAEDGSIIIYKILRRHPSEKGRYVDCHTRKVSQTVGSYVHMDASLVDHNRHTECSNGLHVARRGYIREFSGDVCTMGKLAPEDVIAVPHGDANKMRVCGYHIIFELSEADFNKLRSNQPITDTVEGQTLLAKAIAGNHTGITEYVKIGAQQGGNVTITPAEKPVIINVMSNSTEKQADRPRSTPKLAHAIDVDAPAEIRAPVVDPKEVARAVDGTRADEPEAPSLARRADALYHKLRNADSSLLRQAAATDLRDLKKQARKSWAYLGLPELTGEEITRILSEPSQMVSTKPVKAQTRPAQSGAQPVKPVTPPRQDEGDPVVRAKTMLKEGKLTSMEIAQATGLSKDQIYRIKKKLKA
jgi:hypothetical protein